MNFYLVFVEIILYLGKLGVVSLYLMLEYTDTSYNNEFTIQTRNIYGSDSKSACNCCNIEVTVLMD